MAITIHTADTKTAIAGDPAVKTLTITKPTNLANNDVLVAFVSKSDNSDFTGNPEDWVVVVKIRTTAGSDYASTILYKVISNAAGEPADYTWTCGTVENWAGGIVRLSGVDNGTPLDVANSVLTGQNYPEDETSECESVTTVTDNALFFAFLSANHNISGVHAGAPGMTNCLTVENGLVAGNLGASTFVDYATKTPAGATGDKIYDLDAGYGSAEWHTYQVAFRPEGVVGLSIPVAIHHYKQAGGL